MDKVAQFLESNAAVVVSIVCLSVAANVVLVVAYFRENRRLQQERAENTRLTESLESVERLFQLADVSALHAAVKSQEGKPKTACV